MLKKTEDQNRQPSPVRQATFSSHKGRTIKFNLLQPQITPLESSLGGAFNEDLIIVNETSEIKSLNQTPD